MNKEVAQYINGLLAERERLMEERKDDHNQWQSIPELYADLKKDGMLGHAIYYQPISQVISTFKEIALKLSLMKNGI